MNESGLLEELQREKYNLDTLKMADELVKENSALALADKASRLETLFFRSAHLNDGDLELLENVLVNAKIISKKMFESRMKELRINDIAQSHDSYIKSIAQIDDPITEERSCKQLAAAVDVSVLAVKRAVRQERERTHEQVSGDTGGRIIVEDIEPTDLAVDGNDLLSQVVDTLGRHIILEQHAIDACALWILLTYSFDAFPILPILAVTSPEKRCGKTSLLEALSGLVYKPLLASNISPSAIFRTIEKFKPCLLIDEADTFLRDNEPLRGIINSGHTRKSAFVVRTNLNTMEPERFSTWCSKVIAMIGDLPGTILDRSVHVKMKRKLNSEKIQKISLDYDVDNSMLRRGARRWANDNIELLRNVKPVMPDIGNDRTLDNWVPLLSIAELIGGEWPERARKAMLFFEKVSSEDSIGQILLGDIKNIFATRDRITSKELVDSLIAVEDHPWSDWRRGKPLTQNGLARLLKPFEIV